jgi:GTP cyclohydrolase I
VGVVIEAEHSCMTLRGVTAPGASLTTSHLSGAFRDDPRTREDFLRLTRK